MRDARKEDDERIARERAAAPPKRHRRHSTSREAGLENVLTHINQAKEGGEADPEPLLTGLEETCFVSAETIPHPTTGRRHVAFVLHGFGSDRSPRIVDPPTFAFMRLAHAFGGVWRIHRTQDDFYYVRFQVGQTTLSLIRIVADARPFELAEQIHKDPEGPLAPFETHLDQSPTNLRVVPWGLDPERPTRRPSFGRPEAMDAAVSLFDAAPYPNSLIWQRVTRLTPRWAPEAPKGQVRGAAEYRQALSDALSLIPAATREA